MHTRASMLPRPLTLRRFGWGDGGGYHVYKDIWATVAGEELPRQRKDGNRAAVAVVRGEVIVGHVPKKISYEFALSV